MRVEGHVFGKLSTVLQGKLAGCAAGTRLALDAGVEVAKLTRQLRLSLLETVCCFVPLRALSEQVSARAHLWLEAGAQRNGNPATASEAKQLLRCFKPWVVSPIDRNRGAFSVRERRWNWRGW